MKLSLQGEAATILAENRPPGMLIRHGSPENKIQKGTNDVKTLLNVSPRERTGYGKAGPGRPPAALVALRTGRNQCPTIRVAPIILMLASFAAAQTLTGTVTNSTTRKPSAGDEIVVFKLAQGMEEVGRTKTDAEGRFIFKLDAAQAPHLVRAIHQGVTYHRMASPGTTSVALEVYDVAKKVDGVGVVADIMRIQSMQGQILVTRSFGVRNTSNPPRTQMNEHNLEFYVPDDAQVIDDSATATAENGTPVKSAPVREGEKNRYSFISPLRPGFTRFEVTYQLPYSGSVNLDPKSIYRLEHFVVIVPKSMQFKPAASSTGFKSINFPNQPDVSVRVASNTERGENLAFNISGRGPIEIGRQNGTQGSGKGLQSSAGGAASTQPNNRPGGGLGPPIDAPDPLQQYRWWILGSFAAALLISGVYVAWRQQSMARAWRRQMGSPSLGTALPRAPVAAGAASMLMEGIKEELLQIEVERKQGQISQPEYEEARAALDQTLDRALKREMQKA